MPPIEAMKTAEASPRWTMRDSEGLIFMDKGILTFGRNSRNPRSGNFRRMFVWLTRRQ